MSTTSNAMISASSPKQPQGPPHSYNSGISDGTAVADEAGVLLGKASKDSTHDTALEQGYLGLPKGAMPASRLSYVPDASPPATPSQRLLDPDQSRVQFASYPSDEKRTTWEPTPRIIVTGDSSDDKPWIPLPLRTWFWVTLVLFLAGGAIALEVALRFSRKNQGWATKGDITDQAGVMHYVYTLPPVAVAAFLVAMWTWTDIEIKKMQPYVDLVHGDSPPHRSLLLDYTRHNNFFVWTRAAANKHYLVALTSLMVLLSLSFQPLAAALLVVRDTWWTMPDMTVSSTRAVGLNQGAQFDDLTVFLSASGYAGASILYDLDEPPFTHDVYTVAPFELPRNVVTNGTVFANTTALKSDSGCRPITVNMQQNADGSGWTNSVNSSGCTFTWSVDRNTSILFGTDTPNCTGNPLPQFAPIIFWFFTYTPSAAASGTICSPSFSLFDVNVNVDLASGNLTKVTELRPFTTSSNFSSFSGNVTGPPLNGRAYNGIKFNLTNPDRFVLERENAIQLQMPAAVLQAAIQSPEGLTASFTADRFVQRSTQVYTTYLKLIANSVYFVPVNEPLTIQVKTFRKRLFLSDAAVHLLATAMLLLALFALIIQLFHRSDRRNLRLRHEPGTIASAVSIGAQTGAGELLAGRQKVKDLDEALRGKKFRIDPVSMKIIMEGEEGYEFATSPGLRRQSVFAALQNAGGGVAGRISRRLSKVAPGSPRGPRDDA